MPTITRRSRCYFHIFSIFHSGQMNLLHKRPVQSLHAANSWIWEVLMWWQSFEKCHFFPVFVEYTTGGYLSASTRPATRHPRLDKSTGGIGTSQVASKLEIDSVSTVWVSTLCCFGLQTLPRVLPRRRVKPTTKSIKTGMDWHST